ncbi:mitogen-activated protein kinase kinase kinase YODA-like isoform X2 [Asparagus officinalis]|uniref:mitogen-activated protein kinase kinase kinase YODA-like isoform X2 n=1 Tax=Asparagus officinalis TaxID=4686 RepID=UPI00098E54BC|nr:mitogen-activated protein kinase kinase kinase YODA-like isoform X2 [Asparagus officinalis]
MPSWWSKSSSKDVKKKTTKENLIDTLQRFISPTEQRGLAKPGGTRRDTCDTTSEKGSRSRAESRSTSPSTQVSRCQSFDWSHAQPLPLPGLHSGVTHTPSGVSVSKPVLEKRGKPPLFLPLPTPDRVPRRPVSHDTEADLTTASVSSDCSVDSDDPAESRLYSPVSYGPDDGGRVVAKNNLCPAQKHQTVRSVPKNAKELLKPVNLLNSQSLSTSPKRGVSRNQQGNIQVTRHGAVGSAPDSSMSSPSRSPMRAICPEQIPTSAFLASKPYLDVTFLGSGQCSSPGSGQTSGHNSLGGDMLGQLFGLQSRGSQECSPIPSPRMTSPGPGSRIHSGAVSPLHPRAGGTAPGSPTSRHDEGKKQSHRLPLPPIDVSNISPFSPNNLQSCTSPPIPRSPGKTENLPSPGSRWKKGKMIGRGTFGHVYVGFNSESGEMCAMKEVTLFDDAKSKESAKQLGQEISLLSRLRHQNIVQYYGSEMIDDRLYIYLEYVSGGSIHKLLQEYGQFGEPAIRSYTQQILSGLAYLHAKNTVHRDIKGANILVDPNGRVKLADFGMAKHIAGQSCPLSFKGSPYWMAPEVIKNTNGCNLAVDIWSLGCTVLEMATSKPPWSQYEGIAAMFKIGNSKDLPPIPDYLSDEGKNFIRQCLQREPSRRPTAADLLQHPFVRNAAPLEKVTLSFDPLEQPIAIANERNSKGVGHVRNLSSVDMERPTIYHRRCPKFSAMTSGRMSPSPISSPKTTSGSSTPLTGGNGALPFNQRNQLPYLHEGFVCMPRCASDLYITGSTHHDPRLDFIQGIQQVSPISKEKSSETDILSLQFGRSAHMDHVKVKPSLDLCPGSPNIG